MPAKFPDAVEAATGIRPPLPPVLADLYEREENFTAAPNRLDAVEALVRAAVRRNADPGPTGSKQPPAPDRAWH